MRQGYELWAASGAVVTTPFYLAMRAEGLALDDRPEDGLVLLEQALAIVERTGERYYEAEVRRLWGRFTFQSASGAGVDRTAEGEDSMVGALEFARSHELGSLQLRAALDLSAVWEEQHRRGDALDLVQAAVSAIQGGEGTRDLVVARERLGALQATA
jgi:predicted ATPase